MTALIIVASSHKSADILYASGFTAPDPFIFVSCGIGKTMYVSALEYSRAVKEVKKGINVCELVDASIKKTVDIILEKHKDADWVVPDDFPFSMAEHMRAAGASVSLKDGLFFPERLIKTPAEIKNLVRASRLAEKAMARVVTLLSDSSVDSRKRLVAHGQLLTSEFLQGQIDCEMAMTGASADDTIVACGMQGAEPHNRGTGQIFAGMPIVVDIFPKLKSCGYWGDITRTFVKGKSPSIVKKAYNAVKEARDFSKSVMRKGAVPCEVHAAAVRILEKHGFATGKTPKGSYGFFHSLGHGLGLEIHENPRLSPKNSVPLETGNVVTVEPGLYYPEWGGIRLEDTVIVKDDSVDTITSFPTVLEIG